MKTKATKFLAVALSLLLMLSVLPFSVLAGESAAAAVDGVEYATFEEAVAAAADGATITVLADISSARVNLEDKSLTVNLNGHTLTSTAAYGVAFCVKNGHTLTINGTQPHSRLVGTVMVTNDTYGHIILNGGTYESSQYCPVYINGACLEGSTLTITNATITAIDSDAEMEPGWAMYLAGPCTTTIQNTTVTAPVTAIELRAGTLTLNHSIVTGGNGEVSVAANGNGSTVKNAAVAVSQHNTKKDTLLTVQDSTLTATAAVYQVKTNDGDNANVELELLSGTFRGMVYAETARNFISGGIFSAAVDANYCVTGFVIKENADKTSRVEPAIAAVVDNTEYESFEAAVAAAADGATITLLGDVYTPRINLTGKSLTVDLNSHTLTSTAAYGVAFNVVNGNTLTIIGTMERSRLVGTIMVTNNAYGHIVLNGGTYENSLYCPLYINGACLDGSTLTITDATITGIETAASAMEDGLAMYLAGPCTTTISNTTVTSPTTAIELRAGTLTLENSTVTGGNGEVSVAANGNGSTVANAAVAVSQHNTERGTLLTVKNSTLTATAAVYQVATNSSDNATVALDLQSGTFCGTVYAETVRNFVSGGTFTAAVDANYCAAGFAPKANADGTYGVQPASNVKKALEVSLGGGTADVLVDGVADTWSNDVSYTYPLGTVFTLTAKAAAGKEFLFWKNADGRVVSDAPTYTFTLGDSTALSACYYTPVEGKRYVLFRDMNDRIQSAIELAVETADGSSFVTLEIPSHTNFAGFTFLGWVNAAEDIVIGAAETGEMRIAVDNDNPVVLTAKYIVPDTTYTVTVKNGTKTPESGKYAYSSLVTVTADAPADGMHFIGWYQDGVCVSYNKVFSFHVVENIELEARYAQEEAVIKPVLNLTVGDRETLSTGSQTLVLNVTWSLPEGYTLLEAGLIRTLDDGSKELLALDNVDGTTVKKNTASVKTAAGTYQYTLTLGTVSSAKTVYVKGYLICTDADGNLITVYTDLCESAN